MNVLLMLLLLGQVNPGNGGTPGNGGGSGGGDKCYNKNCRVLTLKDVGTLSLGSDFSVVLSRSAANTFNVALGGTDKLKLTTAALVPATASGLTIGTVALPFQILYLSSQIIDSAGTSRFVMPALSTTTVRGTMANAANAIAITFNTPSYTTAGALIGQFQNNSVAKLGIDKDGALVNDFTDGSGTTGNQTINKPRFKGAFAAGSSQITITNSVIAATDTVLCTLETNDTTALYVRSAIPAAGSVQLNTSANATGTTVISCQVFK